MSVQVLVVTMDRENMNFLDKMNIQSDLLVGNQCEKNEVLIGKYKGYSMKVYSFNERGVGLNRNNLLMRTNAEYCLFADDDIEYVGKYPELVENSFANLPDAGKTGTSDFFYEKEWIRLLIYKL